MAATTPMGWRIVMATCRSAPGTASMGTWRPKRRLASSPKPRMMRAAASTSSRVWRMGLPFSSASMRAMCLALGHEAIGAGDEDARPLVGRHPRHRAACPPAPRRPLERRPPSLAEGTESMRSPVPGFRTAIVAPSEASHQPPAMSIRIWLLPSLPCRRVASLLGITDCGTLSRIVGYDAMIGQPVKPRHQQHDAEGAPRPRGRRRGAATAQPARSRGSRRHGPQRHAPDAGHAPRCRLRAPGGGHASLCHELSRGDPEPQPPGRERGRSARRARPWNGSPPRRRRASTSRSSTAPRPSSSSTSRESQLVAIDFQVGDRSQLHCTSIGKALLAFQDDDDHRVRHRCRPASPDRQHHHATRCPAARAASGPRAGLRDRRPRDGRRHALHLGARLRA